MKLLKGLKDFIYKADFFYTAEMLRYEDQPQYRTLLGGFLSISIIVILLITFYTTIGNTINKVIIKTTTQSSNLANPPPYNITTVDDTKFMFGVQIWHENLNEGPMKFDIVLVHKQFATGENIYANTFQYALEPCTLQHWKQFPEVQKDFNRLNMNFWMCLPMESTYEIKGKYASQVSRSLAIEVRQCKNSSKHSRSCDSPQNIKTFFEQGNVFYTIYFINPLINADSQNYLTYYLEDNNYIIFTNKLGAEAYLFMEGFQIQTDQSILPFQTIRNENGGIVSQFALKNYYEIKEATNTTEKIYSSFSFFKSGIQKKYIRTFSKLDETFAYIGGLFGTISIMLLIVSVYNGYSFEINIGSYLFRGETKDVDETLKNYNFFYFLGHLLYTLLKLLGFKPNWKSLKQYYNCREEMLKQLDILYLLKRILFLQKSIEILFDDHQLNSLYFHKKMTLHQAGQKRKKHKLPKIFIKNKQKSSNTQSEDEINLKKNMINTTEIDLQNHMNLNYKANQFFESQQNPPANNNHKINDHIKIEEDFSPKIYPQHHKSQEHEEVVLLSSDSELQSEEDDYKGSLIRLKEDSQQHIGKTVKIWDTIDQSIQKQINKIYGNNELVKHNKEKKHQYEINRQETMQEHRGGNYQSQTNIYHQNTQEFPSMMMVNEIKMDIEIQKPQKLSKLKPKNILLNNKQIGFQHFEDF